MKLPLLVVERTGLAEDRVGDRDLADVVELRRAAEGGELALRQPELPPDRQRQALDRVAVLAQLRGAAD